MLITARMGRTLAFASIAMLTSVMTSAQDAPLAAWTRELAAGRMNDTGLGPDLNAGFAYDLSRRLSLRPEIRWLDASIQSRLNLGVTRAGALVAYRW